MITARWFISLLAVVLSSWSSAQVPTEEQVRSPDWELRREAFAALIGADTNAYIAGGAKSVSALLRKTIEMHPETADLRSALLIRLMEIENEVVEQKERLRIERGVQELPEADRFSEEYAAYYGDVITAVTTLQDPRSMNVLLGAISSGGMVARTLVSFGPMSVAPVAELFARSDRPLVRSSAVRVLTDLLARVPTVGADAIHRAAVKRVLMEAAVDDEFILRLNAVRGLVMLGDADAVDLVERMAEEDPYRAEFAEGRFVVREAARDALRQKE